MKRREKPFKRNMWAVLFPDHPPYWAEIYQTKGEARERATGLAGHNACLRVRVARVTVQEIRKGSSRGK